MFLKSRNWIFSHFFIWSLKIISNVLSMFVAFLTPGHQLHVQSESALYSCLNIKELLAQNRQKIWSLSKCNWTQTHKDLVCKRTLNHLDNLASLSIWMVDCSFNNYVVVSSSPVAVTKTTGLIMQSPKCFAITLFFELLSPQELLALILINQVLC